MISMKESVATFTHTFLTIFTEEIVYLLSLFLIVIKNRVNFFNLDISVTVVTFQILQSKDQMQIG